MNKTQQLTQERATLLGGLQGIVDTAKSAGRDLRPDESADLEKGFERVKTIDADLTKYKDSADLLARIGAIRPGGLAAENGGNLFSESDAKGFLDAARSKGTFGTTISYKAAMTTDSAMLPSIGQEVVAADNVNASYALRDLFRPALANAGTVRYYTLGNPLATDVAIVAEGGLKPEATVAYAPVDAELVKLASRFSVTDELSEDAPFLIQEIQQSVLRAILARENQLVTDTWNATSGILTGGGLFSDMLDVLADEIGQSEAINGVAPTAVVLNPADLAKVRMAKASSAGSYFIDPLSTNPTTIHGVRLISTPTTVSGTSWLLTSGFGTFYTRGTLRVEAGFTGDDWIYNRLTVRAEERVLPTVQRPSYVTKLSFTAV